MRITAQIEFTITDRSDDRVVGEMPVQPGILNPFGVAHAGALVWFADVCATVLAAGRTDFVPGAGDFPLGVGLNAHFMSNQQAGVLTATSVFVKRGRRLSVVRTTITGDGGRIVADITTSHVPAKG